MTKRNDQRNKKATNVMSQKGSVDRNAKTEETRKDFKTRKSNRYKPKDSLNTSGRDNDPNWYFTDAEIANLASSISFGEYLGVQTELKLNFTDASDNSIIETRKAPVPSVMSIGLSPCPGNVDDTQRGINLAALKMYSELSSMNAKATSYAPQDLTMLMLSLGEVISLVEHIRRAFGVAFTYNMRNRDMPIKLLTAMGFDANDFLTNIAGNRLRFNTLITAINKIPFLSNISYFFKCADLYQRVYADSDSAMAQLIVMCPHTTWVLKEDYSDAGSGLVTKTLPTPTSPGTFSTWINIVKDMVDKLFQSSTFNYIYSDVLNYSAKKGATLMFLDYLLEGYSVVPEYNMNFLLQVHNATIVGETYSPKRITNHGNDVYCVANKNQVDWRAVFVAPHSRSLNTVIFDFPTDHPTTEDIIEASRFTALGSTVFIDTDTEKTAYYFGSGFPDHYCNVLYLGDVPDITSFKSLANSILSTDNDENLNIWTANYLSKVDWAPLFYTLSLTSNGYLGYLGDVDYFTTINRYYLSKVNDIAMLSLFTLR